MIILFTISFAAGLFMLFSCFINMSEGDRPGSMWLITLGLFALAVYAAMHLY